MKPFTRTTKLIVAALAICLTGAAITVAQHQATGTAALADVRALSAVFRDVADKSLPAIVSIRTRGSAMRMTRGMPFDDDHPLFRHHDPRFRRFLEQFMEQMEDGQEFRRPDGQGSGFIIESSGVVVTNAHVVADAEEVTVRLHDGREFTATDVVADELSDIAIVRFDAPSGLSSLRLGDSDQARIGDWVLAIGSPFGHDHSVTAGIISAKGRGLMPTQRQEFIQTDAAINPGNSGGPLLNLEGEVIGVNTAISSRSGGYDGLGFAVPAKLAKWAANQLVKSGEVKRAFLGISIQNIDSTLARQFNISVPRGVVITRVLEDSPAARADLQPGDVVVAVDGRGVTNMRNLQGLIEKLEFDREYELTIIRKGQEVVVPITVRQMQDSDLLASTPSGNVPGDVQPDDTDSFDEIGIEIRSLTAGLARQLSLPSAKGVFISSVGSGSPADRAGLEPGLVITHVGADQTPVESVEDYRKAMARMSLDDGIMLLIQGRQRSRFVVVEP